MATHEADGRPEMPPAYSDLLELLVMPLALEAVHRSIGRSFDLDARQNSEYDESTLRVLLCLRLAPGGALRAKDISVQMLKSTSHVSRLIDRAEDGGLVARHVDPGDRRAHRVVLTDRGTHEIDAYVPHAVAMLDDVFRKALSADELAKLISLLERVEATVLERVASRETERRR